MPTRLVYIILVIFPDTCLTLLPYVRDKPAYILTLPYSTMVRWCHCISSTLGIVQKWKETIDVAILKILVANNGPGSSSLDL